MRNPAVSPRSHSTPNARLWQAGLLVPLGLLVLTTIYFWPQLVGGRVLYWGDIGLYFTPMQSFLRENLRAGRMPLWNPLILCGTPYVGNPQTWPLYPTTALLPFVSAPYFLNLTVALHVWLAGLGTYLFARRALALGRPAACLAAITFMFGGQLVSKEQFPNMVQAAAWLPWILWTLDTLLRHRRLRDALGLGLALGLQLLAAHVQMTVLTLYLAAAWAVFVWRPPPAPATVDGGGAGTHPAASGGPPETGGRRVSENAVDLPSSPLRFGGRVQLRQGGEEQARRGSFRLPPRQRWQGRGGLLLLSGAVAAGLAAGQLLPTLALFRDAARQRLAFSVVNRFFLPPNELGNFVLPRLHGHPFYGDWTARGNFWETCCYIGWLPFALAVWGAVAAWRRNDARLARFWVGVLMVGIWMALGGNGGLYHLAYFVLPGFRSFHDPARCLLWVCFALSLLAGYGCERFTPPAPNNGGAGMDRRSLLWLPHYWGRGGLILLAFADLTYFGRTLYPLADPAVLFPSSPNLATVERDADVRAHQARILAPSSGVWLRFTSYRDFRQELPEYQNLWADTLTPNLTMPYGLSNAYGYEPLALKNAQTVAGQADHAFDPKASAKDQSQASAWAGALGVKYVALCRVTPPEQTIPGLIPVRADPTVAPPRGKPDAPAFIYLSRNAQWQPRAHLEGSARPVALTDDGPDQVTLFPKTTGPARVILADTLTASWSATVDGAAMPILMTNDCLRAVALPRAGAHTVVFSYRPTPFLLGLYFSLLTLGGLIGSAAFAGARIFFRREGFRRRGVE